jgi:hypothetical protein
MDFTKQMTETELRTAISNSVITQEAWVDISCHQKLSEEFIREFKEEVDWYDISRCQALSEEFISEFEDLVDWEQISKYQVLSNEFIEEFKERLKLDELCINSAHHCGKNNRTILIKKSNPSIIHIGCFEGTKKEAIKAVQKKYGLNSEYEKQIIECFNF